MVIKTRIAKASLAKLAKSSVTLKASKVFVAKKRARGARTYKKVSGSKSLLVDKTTGKITVKKAAKAGAHKLKVRIRAAGNANFKAKTQTVMVKVVVK